MRKTMPPARQPSPQPRRRLTTLADSIAEDIAAAAERQRRQQHHREQGVKEKKSTAVTAAVRDELVRDWRRQQSQQEPPAAHPLAEDKGGERGDGDNGTRDHAAAASCTNESTASSTASGNTLGRGGGNNKDDGDRGEAAVPASLLRPVINALLVAPPPSATAAIDTAATADASKTTTADTATGINAATTTAIITDSTTGTTNTICIDTDTTACNAITRTVTGSTIVVEDAAADANIDPTCVSPALASTRPAPALDLAPAAPLLSYRPDDGPLVLLIDKVNATSVVRNGETRETFRLWLSDGAVSIQALFCRGALDMLVDGTLTEGSYIHVQHYQVLEQPRVSGKGKVLVLLASDVLAAGHDGRGGGQAAPNLADDLTSELVPTEQNTPERARYTPDKNTSEWVDRVPEQVSDCRAQRESHWLDQDPNDPPTPMSKISLYHEYRSREADAVPPTLPQANDHAHVSAQAATERPESVDMVPSPKAYKAGASAPSTPQKAVAPHKRKAAADEAADGTSQRPLAPLDANRRPGSGGWMAKRQRLQEETSPEKLLKMHSDAILANLKAIQASPSKAHPVTPSHKTDHGSTSVAASVSSPKKTPSSQGTRTKTQTLLDSYSPSKLQLVSPSKRASLSRQLRGSRSPGTASPTSGQAGRAQSAQLPQQKHAAPVPPSARRPSTSSSSHAATKTTGTVAMEAAASTSSPLKTITRPVRLTPLSMVTGRNASRNRLVDVLAVVTHVNPRLLVRRSSGFPDSRELLLMDCSAPRLRVHLTVFVDAARFHPAPGTVALLRNLTTHDYGCPGSLKAYPQRCRGTVWFIPAGDAAAGWQADWDAEAARLAAFWPESDLATAAATELPVGTWWTDRGAAAAANRRASDAAV